MADRCALCEFRFCADRRCRWPGSGPLWISPEPQFDELLAVSYSDLEEHTYHAIEAMQSVAERRGETGVAAVRYMEGPDVYTISPELLGFCSVQEGQSAARGQGAKGGSLSGPLSRRPAGVYPNLNSKTRDYLVAFRLRNESVPVPPAFSSPCMFILIGDSWSEHLRILF